MGAHGLMEGSRPTLARRRKVGGDGSPEVFCADEQTVAPVDVARWRSLPKAVVSVLAEKTGVQPVSVVFVDEDTMPS
ncbi:MAG: hypothetical protein R2705_24715 [Ilumatobacteraceae bacterium]